MHKIALTALIAIASALVGISESSAKTRDPVAKAKNPVAKAKNPVAKAKNPVSQILGRKMCGPNGGWVRYSAGGSFSYSNQTESGNGTWKRVADDTVEATSSKGSGNYQFSISGTNVTISGFGGGDRHFC